MLYKKLLLAGTLSTLVSGTALFAQQGDCVGGVCFVNLDKIKPTKGFEKKKKPLVVLEKPRFIAEKSESLVHNNTIDKTLKIIVDDVEIFVFPSYVMSEAEKATYYAEQEAIALNEKENIEANENFQIVGQSIAKVDEKILEKTELPLSDFYCEKDTHPVYDKLSDSFECVT